MLDIQTPPAYYQSIPAPRHREVVIPMAQLPAACPIPVPRGAILYGCSIRWPGGCIIYLPRIDDVISRADQQQVRTHELAHCKGWPANHPPY